MTREVRIAHVISDGGWTLDLYRLGSYYRVRLTNPEGLHVLSKSLLPSKEEAFAAVRVCLLGQKLEHTAVALNQTVAAELLFSGQASS